jgi:hypothetical protein
MERHAQLARHIEQAGDAERGIDQEAANGGAGAIHVALQHVVNHDDGCAQVAQEAAHAVLRLLRQHAAIEQRRRLDQDAIDHAVEFEDAAVQPFERIIVVLADHDLGRVHGRIALRNLMALNDVPRQGAAGLGGADRDGGKQENGKNAHG